MAAQNKLKQSIRASSEPDRVNQIGREQLGTNVFRKDKEDVFDVITYEYDFLKDQLQDSAEEPHQLPTMEYRLAEKVRRHMRALEDFQHYSDEEKEELDAQAQIFDDAITNEPQ